ncbi:MAG: hypothetical protein HC772_09215 [Leptolyngbyaceae cyanobacterium CRU_2_3]|nr:hypothetical protein [Leptolyngbyaceae cyanobacterium CRU_2_3]
MSSEQIPPSPPKPASLQPEPNFGWNIYAELINGRFAMIGFFALILLEVLTHQDFFSWIGVR